MKITDHAVNIMVERDVQRVMWGDGILTDIGGAADIGGHPLYKMDRVLAAMERDKRFEKGYYRGNDRSGRQRLVRGFELKHLDVHEIALFKAQLRRGHADAKALADARYSVDPRIAAARAELESR